MAKQQYDLIVIGAGPGGYVAAIRAAQLGLSVACIDRNAAFGGTCLRVGCIPSKAMLESSERFEEANHELASHGVKVKNVQLDLPAMLKRKDQVVSNLTKGIDALFKKNKVTGVRGQAKILEPGRVEVTDEKGTPQELNARDIIIATGARAATLNNVDPEDPRVDTSTEALSYEKVPKKLVVIGAGYIGIEMGSIWRRLGAEVTVVEYLDRILPGMDSEMAGQAKKLLEQQGLSFRLGSRVSKAGSKGQKAVVELAEGQPIECDRVLVAVGRVPNTEGIGLENVGLELDQRGRLPVDESFATSVSGIYGIGDVISGPMLAHKAEEEGIACVEKIVTGHGHVNYDAIPAVVYTHPEIASVGKTEDELKDEDVDYRKGTFPFLANGRARSLNQTEGQVKVLADQSTDRVLGVHILGPRAGDLIAECAAAMEFGATSEDIARTCHAHPTLAEAVKEAALAVDGRAIHM